MISKCGNIHVQREIKLGMLKKLICNVKFSGISLLGTVDKQIIGNGMVTI